MVLLRTTEAVVAAVQESSQHQSDELDSSLAARLAVLEVGLPVEHRDLVALSKYLVLRSTDSQAGTSRWRLDALLKGSSLYVPPPAPKPEPSAEYKELMQKLRKGEEQRQYERMTAAAKDPLALHPSTTFNPLLAHGHNDTAEFDETTYQDVDRQLTLIINVLVTVIASGVTLWFAARYWAVHSRLALALLGSLAIAIAEVVVYMGYIRRIEEAKTKERKQIEHKEVSSTWVIERKSAETTATDRDGIRHRKGKHR